ncbi:hypothetical protein C8Q76DRAFT_689449 [Earliella scabrosa]|nr:hypothetical protein C8Q76DRAFT_689449 [Earliella scabrosa]
MGRRPAKRQTTCKGDDPGSQAGDSENRQPHDRTSAADHQGDTPTGQNPSMYTSFVDPETGETVYVDEDGRPIYDDPQPANPFMLFRSEAAKSNKGGRQPEISKAAASRWNAFSREEKAVYERKCATAKARYEETHRSLQRLKSMGIRVPPPPGSRARLKQQREKRHAAKAALRKDRGKGRKGRKKRSSPKIASTPVASSSQRSPSAESDPSPVSSEAGAVAGPSVMQHASTDEVSQPSSTTLPMGSSVVTVDFPSVSSHVNFTLPSTSMAGPLDGHPMNSSAHAPPTQPIMYSSVSGPSMSSTLATPQFSFPSQVMGMADPFEGYSMASLPFTAPSRQPISLSYAPMPPSLPPSLDPPLPDYLQDAPPMFSPQGLPLPSYLQDIVPPMPPPLPAHLQEAPLFYNGAAPTVAPELALRPQAQLPQYTHAGVRHFQPQDSSLALFEEHFRLSQQVDGLEAWFNGNLPEHGGQGGAGYSGAQQDDDGAPGPSGWPGPYGGYGW